MNRLAARFHCIRLDFAESDWEDDQIYNLTGRLTYILCADHHSRRIPASVYDSETMGPQPVQAYEPLDECFAFDERFFLFPCMPHADFSEPWFLSMPGLSWTELEAMRVSLVTLLGLNLDRNPTEDKLIRLHLDSARIKSWMEDHGYIIDGTWEHNGHTSILWTHDQERNGVVTVSDTVIENEWLYRLSGMLQSLAPNYDCSESEMLARIYNHIPA